MSFKKTLQTYIYFIILCCGIAMSTVQGAVQSNADSNSDKLIENVSEKASNASEIKQKEHNKEHNFKFFCQYDDLGIPLGPVRKWLKEVENNASSIENISEKTSNASEIKQKERNFNPSCQYNDWGLPAHYVKELLKAVEDYTNNEDYICCYGEDNNKIIAKESFLFTCLMEAKAFLTEEMDGNNRPEAVNKLLLSICSEKSDDQNCKELVKKYLTSYDEYIGQVNNNVKKLSDDLGEEAQQIAAWEALQKKQILLSEEIKTNKKAKKEVDKALEALLIAQAEIGKKEQNPQKDINNTISSNLPNLQKFEKNQQLLEACHQKREAILQQKEGLQKKQNQLLTQENQLKKQQQLLEKENLQLSRKILTLLKAQQTIADLSSNEKKVLMRFLTLLGTNLKIRITHFFKLLKKDYKKEDEIDEIDEEELTEDKEELIDVLHSLQYVLKLKIGELVPVDQPAISTDRIVNAFLCYWVDIQEKKSTIKEIKNIQGLYIAQYQFYLIAQIENSLKPQLQKYAQILNLFEKKIVIEEIITLELAETLMELDTFMQSNTITTEAKEKVITEAFQKLTEIISIRCSERFEQLKTKLSGIVTVEDIQSLKQQISLLTLTSFITKKENKGKVIKQILQNVSKKCFEQTDKVKTLLHLLANKKDKQAEAKLLLQKINQKIKENINSIRENIQDNSNLLELRKKVSKKVTNFGGSITTTIKNNTPGCPDLSDRANFTAWFDKLKTIINAQDVANACFIIIFVLFTLLNYCQKIYF